MFADLVEKNRTTRRFHEDHAVDRHLLCDLVDLARLSASGGNKQPLKFIVSCDPDRNAKIFPHLAWAGSLKDWPGPSEGERPSAYIIILLDREISQGAGVDHGIAAQSITLGACQHGLGCCMMGAIKRDAIRQALAVPERYDILLVVAIGKPKEEVVVVPVPEDGNTAYYRDEKGTHYVPKRSLAEIILD